jgi:hypothetical protein
MLLVDELWTPPLKPSPPRPDRMKELVRRSRQAGAEMKRCRFTGITARFMGADLNMPAVHSTT